MIMKTDSESPAALGMSKRAFARRHGVSPSRVTAWAAQGLPLDINGQVKGGKGDAWVAANLDPDRRAAAKEKFVGKVAAGLTNERARKIHNENALLDLELARKRGSLIDRDDTIRALQDFAVFQRDAWLGWIARTVPELAAATGAEPGPIFAVLDRLVRAQLGELARMPLPEFARDA